MEVIFYNFSKLENSLSRPSGEGDVQHVSIKDSSSMREPVIELQIEFTGLAYNYMFIPQISRYYYIRDWVSTRGLWEAHCSLDVLATWADQIKERQAYIVYSSSSYSSDIVDGRVISKGSFTERHTDFDIVGLKSGQQVTPGGFFCLTTLAGQAQWATGVATTYFMTYQQIQSLAYALLQPDFVEQLKQYFTNPFDGIIDCYYLPFDASFYCDLSLSGPVYLGEYEVPGTTARKPVATTLAVKSKTHEIEIPWIYGDFRNLPPYTSVDFFVPFCGSKPIDPADIYGKERFTLEYSIDVNTGNMQAVAMVDKRVIQDWSGNCRVTLPIGQTQSRIDQIIGGAGGAITALGGVASGNPVLAASGILSAASAVLTPATVKTMGGFSGSVLGAILGNDTTLFQNFRISVVSRNTSCAPGDITPVQGRPCNAVRQISSLTGYVKTEGFSINIPGWEGEASRINAYMDSGVYI